MDFHAAMDRVAHLVQILRCQLTISVAANHSKRLQAHRHRVANRRFLRHVGKSQAGKAGCLNSELLRLAASQLSANDPTGRPSAPPAKSFGLAQAQVQRTCRGEGPGWASARRSSDLLRPWDGLARSAAAAACRQSRDQPPNRTRWSCLPPCALRPAKPNKKDQRAADLSCARA